MKTIGSFGIAVLGALVTLVPSVASASIVRAPAVSCMQDPYYNPNNIRLAGGGISNVTNNWTNLVCPIVDEPTLSHGAFTWFNFEGNDKNNYQSMWAQACAYEPTANAAASCGPYASSGGTFIGGFSNNVILWGYSNPWAANWYATLTVQIPPSAGAGYDSIFMGYTYGN